jgi:CheY-like chemotaxis protein
LRRLGSLAMPGRVAASAANTRRRTGRPPRLEALRQAQALRPDVILVDIGLGDESGFDLARRLVRDGQAGGATVIMISTRAEADYADLIAESPAAGYLAKPELSAQRIGRIVGDSP